MRPVMRTVKVRMVDHDETGRILRLRRKRAGLSIDVVALRAGLSPSYLSALERGDRCWTVHLTNAVALAIKGYWQKHPEGTK